MELKLRITSPHDPAVAPVIAAHKAHCVAITPAESCHFLTAEQLDTPDITIWAAYQGDVALGIGGLKRIDETRGEVKTMHTIAAARGTGVGRKILHAIEDTARADGLASLWLETGSQPEFSPARRLYETQGFQVCAPFEDYTNDPLSAFYTKTLTSPAKGQTP